MSGDAPLPVHTLDRCLACDGRKLRRLGFRYEYRGRFPAVECRACGMRFLGVQPTPEGLIELYGAEYFERDFRCGRSDADSFCEEAFRDENRGLLDAFAALRPPGRLLEVGCATGWLLHHAVERGWGARGVELSAAAVMHARGLGLEVLHGDLLQAKLPPSSFDLVYMGDVLEHVPDCRAVLSEVARVLAPGGHLYLRGPITTNSLARRIALAACTLTGRELVLREPPYHLWEFTPGPLRRLFAAAGLATIEMRQSKIPPGRPHGSKTGFERAVMAVLDAVNVPVTRWSNKLGDRLVAIAKKR